MQDMQHFEKEKKKKEQKAWNKLGLIPDEDCEK